MYYAISFKISYTLITYNVLKSTSYIFDIQITSLLLNQLSQWATQIHYQLNYLRVHLQYSQPCALPHRHVVSL
jgi:hypothetical protein